MSVQGVTALIIAITGLVGSVTALAGLFVHARAHQPPTKP